MSYFSKFFAPYFRFTLRTEVTIVLTVWTIIALILIFPIIFGVNYARNSYSERNESRVKTNEYYGSSEVTVLLNIVELVALILEIIVFVIVLVGVLRSSIWKIYFWFAKPPLHILHLIIQFGRKGEVGYYLGLSYFCVVEVLLIWSLCRVIPEIRKQIENGVFSRPKTVPMEPEQNAMRMTAGAGIQPEEIDQPEASMNEPEFHPPAATRYYGFCDYPFETNVKMSLVFCMFLAVACIVLPTLQLANPDDPVSGRNETRDEDFGPKVIRSLHIIDLIAGVAESLVLYFVLIGVSMKIFWTLYVWYAVPPMFLVDIIVRFIRTKSFRMYLTLAVLLWTDFVLAWQIYILIMKMKKRRKRARVAAQRTDSGEQITDAPMRMPSGIENEIEPQERGSLRIGQQEQNQVSQS